MMWVGFTLAAETVERELGLSWGAAQKALIKACENKEVRSQQRQGGPDVFDDDLAAWLKAKRTKPKGGKVPLVLTHLPSMHPEGVPAPARAPRKAMIRELLRLEPNFGGKLDEATLDKAIKQYNATIRTIPNRIISD